MALIFDFIDFFIFYFSILKKNDMIKVTFNEKEGQNNSFYNAGMHPIY